MEGSLHKLSFCGKQTKKLWFNFPEEMDGCEQKSITNAEEIRMFSNRVIKRITCGIYEAIGSIKFQFSDGVETAQFGTNTTNMLNCSLEVPEGEQITGIRIRHRATTASI